MSDPLFALERLKSAWPDVFILDVEMPRMDSVTFLKHIMSVRPTPAIMCSSLTEAGAATTLEALAAGAVAIVTKPKLGVKSFLADASDDLIAHVKAAATAKVRPMSCSGPAAASSAALHSSRAGAKLGTDVILKAQEPAAMQRTTERIVAIGTSTGGTQALEAIIPALPSDAPGIAVVQHMPEKFTAAFAQRLDKLSRVNVREATNGDRLLPGHVLIAPGGRHLLLKRSGAFYYAHVVDGAPVNRHKPSVDVLFRAVANCAGRNSLGVILTGMGDDGARGLGELRAAGAATIAQDEASCVVFGMPNEAIRLGGAERVVPLSEMAKEILEWSRRA